MTVCVHIASSDCTVFSVKCQLTARIKSGFTTTLTLKVGACIMLVRNVDTEVDLFNKAVGTVNGFIPHSSSFPTAVTVFCDKRRLQKVSSDRFPSLNGSFPVEHAKVRIPLCRE